MIKLGGLAGSEGTMIKKVTAAYAKLPPVAQHAITAAVAAVLAYYGIKG